MAILGIDVAKDKLDCCLLLDGIKGKKKHKTVKNTKQGYASLVTWLQRFVDDLSQVSIGIEPTANYHEPVCLFLHKHHTTVYLLHAQRVRAFANGFGLLVKTDKVDSFVLAGFVVINSSAGTLKQWTPAPKDVQILKHLNNRRDTLLKDKLREQSRLEQILLLDNVTVIVKDIKQSIKHIEKSIAKLDDQISLLIERNEKLQHDKQLLESIPAIGIRSSIVMLNLLHSNTFNNANQLAAYLGLVPIEHSSGTSVFKKSKISKSSAAKVRSQLYMAGVVAIQHNPRVKAHYQKLIAKGKPRMAALIAAIRKLVHMCFAVFKNKQPYDPNFLTQTA